MLNFRITRTPQSRLDRLKHRVRNAEPLMDQLADQEISNAKTRIRTRKTAPDGTPWQPWSYATMEQRRREGTLSGGLLYKEGLLYESFTKSTSDDHFTVSNDQPYAGYLQFGTADMPARPFLGFSEQTLNQIKQTTLRYFRR